MALDRENLRKQIRLVLGIGTSDCDLSQEAIDDAINEALEVYSKSIPFLTDIQVTVPSSGILPMPQDDIVHVFADSFTSSVNDPGIDLDTAFGFGSYPSYSQVQDLTLERSAMNEYLDQYELQRFKESFPSKARINGNQIEFMPAPAETTVVQLRIGIFHTDDTFPRRHRNLLKEGAIAMAASYLGAIRGKFSSVDIGGHKINLKGPGWLFKMYEDRWTKFKNRLGQQRMTSSYG